MIISRNKEEVGFTKFSDFWDMKMIEMLVWATKSDHSNDVGAKKVTYGAT